MNGRILALVCVVIGFAGAIGSSAAATECNAAACWKANVEFISHANGKVWFVVENSELLANLVPADGCNVAQVWQTWEGQPRLALFIAADDPDRKELLNVLNMALAAGLEIGFSPEKNSTGNQCRVQSMSVVSG
ncbi:MAG: hypothetical protein K8J08_02720 [Thermoanaerobaculia bacterium]|nr:hypothetical protein [Thermoanaerobaculia bacterium]